MTRTQSSLHLKHAGEAEADHDYSVWLALTDQAPKLDLSISSFFAGICRTFRLRRPSSSSLILHLYHGFILSYDVSIIHVYSISHVALFTSL